MKKCPYCAEEIQDDAIKCKHCKEWLKTSIEEKIQKNPIKQGPFCKDYSCAGYMQEDGHCSECGRTVEQINNGVPKFKKNKVPINKTGQDVNVKYISCPSCGGMAFGGRSCLIIVLAILLFPIGLILLLLKPIYSCSRCGFKFKA